MKTILVFVLTSLVVGALVLVFSGLAFYQNYRQFSDIILPHEATFGDTYTVATQLLCHAIAIFVSSIQIFSAVEYCRAKKDEGGHEAFQTWFGTLVVLFFINFMLFVLIKTMNFCQTIEELQSNAGGLDLNLSFMLIYFAVVLCQSCGMRVGGNNDIESVDRNCDGVTSGHCEKLGKVSCEINKLAISV